MSARARVGLELVDSVLRYAALEYDEDSRRLLRLGRCDFEFDAVGWLHEDHAPSRLDAIAEAVREVLDGIEATHFHLVVHPPASTVFSAPVPADTRPAERNEQLHWEAGQLMGLDEQTFKIIVHPLRSETREEYGRVDWFYVMALRRSVYEHLAGLLRDVRDRVVPHFSGSVQAASAVVQQMMQGSAEGEASADRSQLLMGQYGDRTEYGLSAASGGSTSCYWERGDTEDAAYAIAQLAESAGADLESIDEFLLYGSSPQDEVLTEVAELTGQQPRRLNPFDALNVDTGGVDDDFPFWKYVGCVGVTL